MTKTQFALLFLGFFIVLSSAHAESRFDELVALHRTGPLDTKIDREEEGHFNFVCFAHREPDLPLHLEMKYQSTGDAQRPIVVSGARTDSFALTALIGGQAITLSPGPMPAFKGLLLAGKPGWENVLKRLDMPDNHEIRLAISRHEPSQRLLAVLFKIETQTGEEACALEEQIRYVCIESRTDN